MLRPDDLGNEWGPAIVTRSFRGPAIGDLSRQQVDVLVVIANRITHLGLRARIADAACTIDRRHGQCAIEAIDAYCECVEQLVDGRATAAFEGPGHASFEASQYLERALKIGYSTRRKRQQPERTSIALRSLYRRACDMAELGVFVRVAELGIGYSLLEPRSVAADAEALSSRATPDHYPLHIRATLDLAARLWAQIGDENASTRCQLASVDRTLAMRDEVSGPGAEAHWIQEALVALRHVKGTENFRRELRRELRDAQADAMGVMAKVPVPLDFGDERDECLRRFDDMDLATALKELACIARPRPVGELREQAVASREQSLSAMLTHDYVDADGLTAAYVPEAPATGQATDD